MARWRRSSSRGSNRTSRRGTSPRTWRSSPMARLIRPEGLVDYDAANAQMHALAERRLARVAEDTLILLEHPPVYTAGRSWRPDHIVWTEERIGAAGAELRFIDRGGSLTFHGPGQLVGYPVLDLGARPDAMR